MLQVSEWFGNLEGAAFPACRERARTQAVSVLYLSGRCFFENLRQQFKSGTVARAEHVKVSSINRQDACD